MAFDLKNPGFKEYAVVFGVTIGGFLLWQHFRGASTPSTAAADTSQPSSSQDTGRGPGIAALWLAIQDLMSQPSSGTTTTTTTPTPAPKPKPKPKPKPPPRVKGPPEPED